MRPPKPTTSPSKSIAARIAWIESMKVGGRGRGVSERIEHLLTEEGIIDCCSTPYGAKERGQKWCLVHGER